MKILFWGTPAFAVPSLRALDDEGFDVVGVVTQPDRPAGRGRRLRPSAIKQVAVESGFPIFTPERPRTPEFIEAIRALDADISVVVAYGHILTTEVLAIPNQGSINVHASLLPALRGAAPINWAIARGHAETGVTIMRMVKAMDAGPIIHQVVEPILPDQTAGDLTLRLSETGAAALVEALALMSAGLAEEVEQDHAAATFAPKIDREVARIDWSRPASEVAAHVRAMDPVPGAWTLLANTPMKLFEPVVWAASDLEGLASSASDSNGGARAGDPNDPPGTVVLATSADGVLVSCGDGAVAFDEAQPPGKRRMKVTAWINGRGISGGQRFE